jgi:IS5 family transposase
LELGEDAIPDESTILHFRHLLEKHNLTSRLFESVKGYLEDKGLLLTGGSIIDAIIIHAPSSTKTQTTSEIPR